MQAKSSPAINPERFGIKLLIAFGVHAEQYSFCHAGAFRHPHLRYFLAVAERNFSRALTGSEFPTECFAANAGFGSCSSRASVSASWKTNLLTPRGLIFQEHAERPSSGGESSPRTEA